MAKDNKLKASEPEEENNEVDLNADDQPKLISGMSTNRPTDVPVRTILYERDTGNRLRYLGGGQWDFIDNVHV